MTIQASASIEMVFRAAGSLMPAFAPSRIASNQPAGKVVRKVPMFIPANQAYFWSSQWQQGEAETRANLKAGNAQTFDDPLDAIRHLLADAS